MPVLYSVNSKMNKVITSTRTIHQFALVKANSLHRFKVVSRNIWPSLRVKRSGNNDVTRESVVLKVPLSVNEPNSRLRWS